MLTSAIGGFNCLADWSNVGEINGVTVYRDNRTGLEWTQTLGRVQSSDWGSSARGMVAQYGFRLPTFGELQQMQRHGGFSPLQIHSTIGNYYETYDSDYLANAAVNGFQTPQKRKGSGRNWVIGVRESSDQVVVVQSTKEQQVTVSSIDSGTSQAKVKTEPVGKSAASTSTTKTTNITPVAFTETNENESSTQTDDNIPNSVVPPVLPISSGTVKSTLSSVKDALDEKIGLIRETLSESSIPSETILAKLKEKNADAAKQSAMLTAIEEGDAEMVQRIWIDVSGDIKEAGRLSRTIKLLSALDSFAEAFEDEDSFENGNFKDLRKVFDKNKLDKDADKKIKPILSSIALYVEVYEKLFAIRPTKKSKNNANAAAISAENINIPEDEVTIIIQPKQNPKEIFAIDETTFLVGKKGESFKIVTETFDNYLPKLPISEEASIVGGNSDNQFTISNPAENKESIRFSIVDKEKLTLAAGETKSYSTSASGQIKVYVNKTRVSSSRRRTTQTYQDVQTLLVKAGVTYDFQVDADKNVQLIPRPVEVTVDNTEGTTTFYLKAENKAATVEASESKVFKADDGILTIRFARSDDVNDTASIDFYQSQTCKPAILSKEGKWSLFPAKK
jgi:hypothetical protein